MSFEKMLALLLALALLACCFAACNSGEENSNEDVTNEESSKEEEKEPVWITDIEDFSPYVTLGEYKGVVIEETVLTPEKEQSALYELMDSLKTYVDIGTERPAKLTDTVIIDYKGYRKDTGEAFEGGEATGHSLVLGSGSFIPGFEDGVVGHSAGEQFDINVTFPEEYHEESLAGVEVRFAITLTTVKEVRYPELTDETAKKLNFETAELLKAQATANAKEAVYEENLQKAWQKAVENAEIKGYPQELYDYTLDSFVDYYVSYYRYMASMYGMELKDYVGMSEEEFVADITKEGKEYTESYLKEEMIVFAIADKEMGREVSEEEYNAKVQEYAEKEGITTEELKKKYEKKAIENNIVWDRVLLFVYENAQK